MVTAIPEILDFRRFDSPAVGLAVVVPEQVYGAAGSSHRATDAAALLARLRSNPDLRVGGRRTVRIGGNRATSVMLSVRASAKRNEFCPGPCAPLVARQRVTLFVSAPAQARLTVLDVHGHAVSILEDTPDGDSLALTEPLVRSLRFP